MIPGKMNRKSGRITIYDIAEKSGASVATVSRVINHPGEVSEETRQHILEVMDEMGYTSEGAGKKKSQKSRGTIVLDYTSESNPFYETITGGLYSYASRLGYEVTTYTESFRMENMKELTRLAKRKSVVGFVSMGTGEKKVLKELSYIVPVIQCMEWQEAFISDIPSVGVGIYEMINKALSHLYEEGAERIVLFNYMLNTEYGRQVLDAYTGITRAHGLDEHDDRIIYSQTGFDQAYIQAMSLLQTEVPDAVVCASDELAISVLRAADRLGILVPGKLKVCGIGNMHFSFLNTMPITTIAGMGEELGEAAGRMLTERIANPYGNIMHDQVETRLLVRESTSLPA